MKPEDSAKAEPMPAIAIMTLSGKLGKDWMNRRSAEEAVLVWLADQGRLQ